jgi:hypothetical protein
MLGWLRLVWQASTVQWCSASLLAGSACTRDYKVFHWWKPMGFKPDGRGGHTVSPPVLIQWLWQVLLRTSHATRPKCAVACTIFMFLQPALHLAVAIGDHMYIRWNAGTGCLWANVAKCTDLPVTSIPYPHINAELLLVSRQDYTARSLLCPLMVLVNVDNGAPTEMCLISKEHRWSEATLTTFLSKIHTCWALTTNLLFQF